MKVFRFSARATGRVASTKPAVIILAPNISDSKAESLLGRFANSLRIAEVRPGTPAREGFFSVLRIHADELETFDYDLKGCRAMLVEGAPGMFFAEAELYCAKIAEKAGLPVERIRLCCTYLSEPGGCNFSCYSASSLRDFAAEFGLTGIHPTSKKERLSENSLCLCVKT